jgi:integrase/recombinase XerD
MLLNEAIHSFITERKAARYSPNTIRDYHVTFNKLKDSIKADVDLANITRVDIVAFLNAQTGVSAKTLRNYHADLSALWQWAVEQGLCSENVIRSIRAPIAEKKDIFPFEEIEALALMHTAEQSKNKVIALRNQAIIYLLLDCGIRASELCGLKVQDVNQTTRHIIVFGKGKKTAKSAGFKIDVGEIEILS